MELTKEQLDAIRKAKDLGIDAWDHWLDTIAARDAELAEYQQELEDQRTRWTGLLRDQTVDHQSQMGALRGRMETQTRKAVLDHTIEARRLYVGTSAENFLNWLDKRIAVDRATLDAPIETGKPAGRSET